jgi:CHAT domain-containing protein
MRMDIDHCQLIFLSGCEMAVNKDILLKEEGLHISGALQMAGVPNTVATWWKIMDLTAVEIATEFYKGLRGCGDEPGGLDVRKSARSLSDTMLKMRRNGMSSLIWGAYVHFGP